VAYLTIKRRKEMKKIFALFLTYFLLACGQSTSNETSGDNFAIYLLGDSTLTAADAFAQPIENLMLAESEFISVHDLKSYNWTSHSFELNDQKRTEFENFILNSGSTSGIPFIVTVGEERIYFGTFWWHYSSAMPPSCALIYAGGPLPYEIKLANDAIDKRSDMRIFNSLKTAGVLVY
jgi:hypothetical protein